MMRRQRTLIVAGLIAALAGLVMAHPAQDKPRSGNTERKVQASEVPKAALDALTRLADKATLTEFAEEVEHGHTFYEGSWRGPAGHVDALVTPSGDLVEIEESIAAEQVPAAVRDRAMKVAGGSDASLAFEKKTFVMYEIHFKKNGKGREVVLTPDGRTYHEEGAGDDDGDEDDGDDDDDDEDEDEDDDDDD